MSNRILSTSSFNSEQKDFEERRLEIQQWMDDTTIDEFTKDPDKVVCFVSDEQHYKVTMLVFENREQRDLEMGELAQDMSDERLYYGEMKKADA